VIFCKEEKMNQQELKGVVSDTATKVEEMAGDLAGQTGASIRGKLDQVARETTDRASALVGEAARVGAEALAQAGDVVQSAAREAGNQASQTATALYAQGARAGGFIQRYAAEQPLTALLLAGAAGYALAYLIHRP
jgi:ElaB/YqjD/DUF883 family membrane-anchored ribosome-binding protein